MVQKYNDKNSKYTTLFKHSGVKREHKLNQLKHKPDFYKGALN